MMWSDHEGWSAGDWVAMSFMMAAFWVLVIAVVFFVIRSLRIDHHVPAGSRSSHAEELLAERFARGEIDEAEFDRRRQLLRGGRLDSRP